MNRLRQIGPGIVIAATGLGAGDLIAASVAGAEYGYALLWAAVLGALLKFSLNEGLARWQLASGTTLLEGWRRHLPGFISWYFLLYLLIWSFVVAGALMAACGLAVHALFPEISVAMAGAVQSLVAAALVITGRYRWLERLMKVFILMMFLVVMYCGWQVFPGFQTLLSGMLIPTVPEGSTWLMLGVIGGVGGSVTLLSYGYWIRERGWRSREDIPLSRMDLAAAYILTALFATAVMLISAGVQPEVMRGGDMVLSVADHLGKLVGDTGKWLFLVGFWGAVFSSMLGVWQGVPYLFCDFIAQGKSAGTPDPGLVSSGNPVYRWYLAGMCLLPMVLLFLAKPVWLVLLYAVVGALFMPLLAGTMLYMNNRSRWVGKDTNGYLSNIGLVCALVLFATLLVREFLKLF